MHLDGCIWVSRVVPGSLDHRNWVPSDPLELRGLLPWPLDALLQESHQLLSCWSHCTMQSLVGAASLVL